MTNTVQECLVKYREELVSKLDDVLSSGKRASIYVESLEAEIRMLEDRRKEFATVLQAHPGLSTGVAHGERFVEYKIEQKKLILKGEKRFLEDMAPTITHLEDMREEVDSALKLIGESK